jgi:uncharacterized protein YuzE
MERGIIKSNKVKAVSVDSEARSLYISFSHNPVTKTVPKSKVMFVDYDKDGKMVGVEVIRLKSAKIAVQKAFQDIQSMLPAKLEGVWGS